MLLSDALLSARVSRAILLSTPDTLLPREMTVDEALAVCKEDEVGSIPASMASKYPHRLAIFSHSEVHLLYTSARAIEALSASSVAIAVNFSELFRLS